MRKLISLATFLATMLAAPFVATQDLPLTQKEWYSLGVVGAPPETSNYNGIAQQIARQTGLVDAAGDVCFARADITCYQFMTLAGPLGIVSLSLMNGADIPVANIGVNVVAGNYAWGGTTGQFVPEQINEVLTDNETPINALTVMSNLYFHDGANWDRVGLINPLPVYKVAIGISDTTTAGTVVDDSADIVCPSLYFLNIPNWSVWVRNAGGGSADALTDVDVQASYDGTNWSSLTSTTCNTLISGDSARCYVASGESISYVQVYAQTAALDDTTVDCIIQGNYN